MDEERSEFFNPAGDAPCWISQINQINRINRIFIVNRIFKISRIFRTNHLVKTSWKAIK